jgi:hypothetical protein
LNSPGFQTPSSQFSRSGNTSQLTKTNFGLVITPPTNVMSPKKNMGSERVYSPASNQPNNQYFEWLNSQNGDDFSEVTAHQASMIQKYSNMGSSALSSD